MHACTSCRAVPRIVRTSARVCMAPSGRAVPRRLRGSSASSHPLSTVRACARARMRVQCRAVPHRTAHAHRVVRAVRCRAALRDAMQRHTVPRNAVPCRAWHSMAGQLHARCVRTRACAHARVCVHARCAPMLGRARLCSAVRACGRACLSFSLHGLWICSWRLFGACRRRTPRG